MTGSLVFLLLCLCFCAGEAVKRDDSWEFLHLAQFWPPTSCYVFFGKKCSGIPKSVTGWTIHGLWPSNPGTEEPHDCNDSLKFDYNQIKSLSPQLKSQWVYFDTSGDPTELWAHEWKKHGTCAGSLPALKGELNYFSKTLKLQKPLDLSGILAKQKIVPSSKVMYKPADIDKAIRVGLGVAPNVVCSYDHTTKHHYLEQVWICFNKTFSLQDCPDVSVKTAGHRGKFNREMTKEQTRFHECPPITKNSVYYLPFTPPSQEDMKHELHRVHEGSTVPKKQRIQSESIYFRSEVEEILRLN